MNNIKLIKGDCLEKLKSIEDKSVDLVINDVPYFSTGLKEVGDKQWKKENDYIDWCLDVINECQRVLKDNGSFYWFHNDINIMVEILHRIKNETKFKLKNQITWSKLNNWKSASVKDGAGMYRSLLQSYGSQRIYNNSTTEYIYYFTLQDELCINSFKSLRQYSKSLQEYIGLKLKDINKTLGHRRAEHFFYHSSTQWGLCTEEVYKELIDSFKIDNWNRFINYQDLRKEYDDLRYRFNQENKNFKGVGVDNIKEILKPYTTVWEFDRDDAYFKYSHITPKPVDMLTHIINTSSNENATILDVTMGSGSTGVACLKSGGYRNFIGIEKEDTYFDISVNRINEYIEENKLDANLEIE